MNITQNYPEDDNLESSQFLGEKIINNYKYWGVTDVETFKNF